MVSSPASPVMTSGSPSITSLNGVRRLLSHSASITYDQNTDVSAVAQTNPSNDSTAPISTEAGSAPATPSTSATSVADSDKPLVTEPDVINTDQAPLSAPSEGATVLAAIKHDVVDELLENPVHTESSESSDAESLDVPSAAGKRYAAAGVGLCVRHS